MGQFVLLAIFSLLLLHLALSKSYPIPSHGFFVFCFSIDILKSYLENPDNRDVVNMFVISRDVSTDGYLSLYLGIWSDLFSSIKRGFRVVVVQPSEEDVLQAGLLTLQLLPRNSIMVAMEHGINAFTASQIDYFSRTLNISRPILFHCNHEKPWTFTRQSMDYTFDSIDQLNRAYSRFPLVLRNYYYDMLLESSIYVPTLAPLYGYMTNNQSSPVAHAKAIPPHERTIFCEFIGRRIYSANVLSSSVELTTSQRFLNEEREMFFNVMESNQSSGLCKAIFKKDQDIEVLDDVNALAYEDYMIRLQQTVFVPCPSGNNPETFRIYEAIEMGAIPILVPTAASSTNFLSYASWKTYPGPILSSWNDLESYLTTMKQVSREELQILQSKVVKWYDEFRKKIKNDVVLEVDRVLDAMNEDNHPTYWDWYDRNKNNQRIDHHQDVDHLTTMDSVSHSSKQQETSFQPQSPILQRNVDSIWKEDIEKQLSHLHFVVAHQQRHIEALQDAIATLHSMMITKQPVRT